MLLVENRLCGRRPRAERPQADRARAARSWDRDRPWRRRCGRTARRPPARRCGCRDAGAASRPARRPPPSRAASGSPAGPQQRARWCRRAARAACASALCACCSAACSCGIDARVLSSSVVAWVGIQLRRRAVLEPRLARSPAPLPEAWRSPRPAGSAPRRCGSRRTSAPPPRSARPGAVVVGHRGEQARGLRLDAAPVLAPEVQLPGRVEAGLVAEQVAGEPACAASVLGQADRGQRSRTAPASGETAGRWRRRTGRAPRRCAARRSAAAGSAGRRARPGDRAPGR